MPRRLAWTPIVIGAVALVTTLADAQSTPVAYDVIIRGGTVIDGSGQPRYAADVGIIRGTIAKVGVLGSQTSPTAVSYTHLTLPTILRV